MAYLYDVLERLPSITNLEAKALLPQNRKKAQVKTD